MKGHFADRGLGAQLLMLFFLAFMGTLFFSALGFAIASGIYNVSIEEVLGIILESGNPAGREFFKVVQGFSTIGTFLVPSLLGSYLLSHHPEEFMGLQRYPKPALFLTLLLVVCAYSMGGLSDSLYRISESIAWPESLLEQFAASQELMLKQYESILDMQSFMDFTQVFLVMALLPAVAEEALFRGTLQPLFQRYLSPHWAIWITAFLFGLLHQQYLAFLSIFALGAVLGYLRYWTNSIWLPTLLHLVNNGSIVVAVYFFKVDYRENLESGLDFSMLENGLLIAILAFCLLIIERISRANRLD